MRLFFLIQNHPLLKFCTDDQGCMAIFHCVFVVFFCNAVSINHLVIYKIAILSQIKPHSDAVDYFKELPFCNKPIRKPKVKRLKTLID